jgi:CBS domain-containing protein
MRISELLETTEEFPTTRTDALLHDAARLMRDADVRAVAVVENDRLVGIVTDWDVVMAFVERTDDIATLPVSAVMTSTGLATIGSEQTVAEATSVLAERRVHHLPVVDGDRYLGMVCLGLEWSEEGMLTPPLRPTLTARHP